MTISLLLAGCERKSEVVFTPTSPVVAWSDLVDGEPLDMHDTFRLFPAVRTRGLFPTSISVVRLAAVADASSNGYDLTLNMSPPVDFLAWNSVFDDFRSVAEVYPLNRMALDGAEVSLPALLHTADVLGAGMLLVYTEAHRSIHASELRGALYDVSTGRLLAQLHAGAFVNEPVRLDETRRYNEPYDDEQRDPRLVSIRAFESTARDCLLALMRNDDPGDRVDPEGWIPDRPIEDLVWPPSEDMLRRRRVN